MKDNYLVGLPEYQRKTIDNILGRFESAGIKPEDIVGPLEGLHCKTNGQFKQILGYIGKVLEKAETQTDSKQKLEAFRAGYRFVRELNSAYTDISSGDADKLTDSLQTSRDSPDLLMRIAEAASGERSGPYTSKIVSSAGGVFRSGRRKVMLKKSLPT